jgi:hypothetical protein
MDDREELERASCARVRGRLERALDGGLAPLEAARDAGHLEVCAECARERDTWQLLFGRVRAELRAGDAPAAELTWAAEGLAARVAAARGPRARGRRRTAAAWLGAAAALLGLLAAGRAGLFAEELEAFSRAGELRAPAWLSDLALPAAVPGLEGRSGR